MSTVEKINVLEHMRRSKDMYLGREEVVPEYLATLIANDALTLGVKQVTVTHCNDWWLISSEDDWLQIENVYGIEDTFHKILPLVGGGLESMRREIFLTAYASAVFTRKDDKLLQIVGSVEANDHQLADCLKMIPKGNRIVGFKL